MNAPWEYGNRIGLREKLPNRIDELTRAEEHAEWLNFNVDPKKPTKEWFTPVYPSAPNVPQQPQANFQVAATERPLINSTPATTAANFVTRVEAEPASSANYQVPTAEQTAPTTTPVTTASSVPTSTEANPASVSDDPALQNLFNLDKIRREIGIIQDGLEVSGDQMASARLDNYNSQGRN